MPLFSLSIRGTQSHLLLHRWQGCTMIKSLFQGLPLQQPLQTKDKGITKYFTHMSTSKS
jgi:hypothetical protein